MANGFLIAVTGKTGAGKTFICEYFKKMGAKVISADEIGWKVREFPEVKAKILKEFGVYKCPALKEIVLRDEEKLKKLNRIVHPVLICELIKEIEMAKSVYPVIVVDCALIGKWRLEELFDTIIVVDAPEKVRFERKKDRFTYEEFKLLCENQPLPYKWDLWIINEKILNKIDLLPLALKILI